MTTKVYRFGLAAPHDGAELVYEQMRLAHQYRRQLVWIEGGRRWATRAAIGESSADIGLAEAAVEGMDAACAWLASEIRVMRAASRSRIYYFDPPRRYTELSTKYPDVLDLKSFASFLNETEALLAPPSPGV